MLRRTEALKLVDRLCDEFESSWQSGGQPSIEVVLDQAPESSRRDLFHHLLELDLDYRRERHEEISCQQYVDRFPTYADIIQDHFRETDDDTEPRRETPGSTTDRRRHSTTQHSADRNLLFGIIALQMDFVSRDALIAGMHAWVLKKTKSLGEILAEQGCLPDQTHKLLDALVDRHVELHDNDVEKSLATIGGVDSVRGQLESIGDVDVEASLSHFPTGRQAGDVSSAQAVTDPPPKALPGGERFRILKTYAKGGIGEVFVAVDRELSREVALKEIQQRYAHNTESRARFLLEAEVTGRLEHPGIVPVYGLGHYPDGRPFYAMRFIRGESLKEAITKFHEVDGSKQDASERRLDFHKLLGRFVDVCNAVEYAHSRGVLHRDLKPGNVMLGKYGETLVVDWGLAKSGKRAESKIHLSETTLRVSPTSGSNPTQMGAIFGTPAYMPPEQAAGRLDDLGPASDVFSLGATLYHILTGQAPFVGTDLDSVIDHVQRGQFPRPCEIKPSVPPALEAVCLKAMSVRSADRFPSPLALAEDIEHWLADEPVSAWNEPWIQRSRRWMRRHQLLVTSVAVALFIGLLSLSISVVLLNAAWNSEHLAKQQAVQNHELAEKHFHQAREAVNEFYTQISEETLLDQPGFQPLRERLLSQSLDYYQEFLRQRGDDPSLKSEVANTRFRVGVITEAVHSPERALTYYQLARDTQQELDAEQPNDLTRLRSLSDTMNAIGRAKQKMRQLDGALISFQTAQGMRERIVELAPEDIESHRKLANSQMNVGVVMFELGEVDEAFRRLETSQEIRQKQLAAKNDLNTQRDLGMGYYNLAVFGLLIGDGEAGEASLRQAIEVFESVLTAEPRDVANEQRLSACYRLLADRRLAVRNKEDVPDWEGALDAYEKARGRLEMLVFRNPDVPDFHASLAGVHLNMAEAERQRGRPAAAIAALQSAGSVLRELSESHQSNPQYGRDYAVALRTLAKIQIEQGESVAARENLSAAKKRLDELLQQFPDDANITEQLAETVELIGKVEAIDTSGTGTN